MQSMRRSLSLVRIRPGKIHNSSIPKNLDLWPQVVKCLLDIETFLSRDLAHYFV